MNTHDKIELPPEFRSGNSVPVTVATIKRERMEEILREAIEADRKRRGEPYAQLIVVDEDDVWPQLVYLKWVNLEPGVHDLFLSPQPTEPVSKTDWNNELSSWGDEDFIHIFHERPDLANRLRKMLAEPVKGVIYGPNGFIATTTNPEPVKVPSDAEIGQILKEVLHNSRYGVHQWELWLEFASALFTRYGH